MSLLGTRGKGKLIAIGKILPEFFPLRTNEKIWTTPGRSDFDSF
jgi:hypothetical protein